jgi:hypothetical protein
MAVLARWACVLVGVALVRSNLREALVGTSESRVILALLARWTTSCCFCSSSRLAGGEVAAAILTNSRLELLVGWYFWKGCTAGTGTSSYREALVGASESRVILALLARWATSCCFCSSSRLAGGEVATAILTDSRLELLVSWYFCKSCTGSSSTGVLHRHTLVIGACKTTRTAARITCATYSRTHLLVALTRNSCSARGSDTRIKAMA